MSLDENDKARAGKLPADPKQDARKVTDAPRILTVRDLLIESRERACSAESRKRDNCVTGVQELERAAGGIRPGFVWVVGGDTNTGKSTWLVHVADENLKRGKRVLIVSVEDAPSLYGN